MKKIEMLLNVRFYKRIGRRPGWGYLEGRKFVMRDKNRSGKQKIKKKERKKERKKK